MSLFQCDKCGCIENTALTRGYIRAIEWLEERPEVYASYRQVLGLKPDEPYGRYCSACNPIWFDGGQYGVGPNPNPGDGCGKWHDKFHRTYLPKGQFETSRGGNLQRKGTTDEDTEPYHSETEYSDDPQT